MKYCEFNGCTNKINKGAYCEDHKRKRKPKKTKNAYHHLHQEFYHSDEWGFTRSQVYERERGLCQRCGKFVFGRKAQVHHIVTISADETLKHELENLMLLCPKCHTIVENEGKQKVIPSYFNKF